MRKLQYLLAFWLLAIQLTFTAACSGDKEKYPPQKITPLYDDIAEYASLDSARRAGIIRENSSLLNDYMAVLDCDHVNDSLMLMISRSKPIQIFTPDVRRVFPSLDSIEIQLGYTVGAAAKRALKLNVDKFAAVVWGRPQSIVFVDSVMLIALNHYLGADYAGYEGMPAYRIQNKTPQMLPYDLAESLVANAYPFEKNGTPTLLNHMLYDGAVTVAKLALVENASIEGALGMTATKLQWFDENEARVWRTLISGRLLYDTSGFKIDRIMLPAPSTDLINPNSPGRAGRYIGFRIVQAYMRKHTDATLEFLLSPEFYNSENILAETGYSPK